jgi:hypothetical protein
MSTNHALHVYLDTEAAAQARRRLLWRMVSALESTFSIPGGDHLVFVLGDGSERDNRHALYSWVIRELQRLELEATNRTLPQLTDRLQRVLSHWDLDRHEA